MNKYSVVNAEFIAGAFKLSDMPLEAVPEVAFVGRSNVGKSSLVNRVTARKSLARVSSTPGRTQQLNLFSIDLKTPDDSRLNLNLVDLPGFGYAKFSKARREVMSRLIVEYIQSRQQLLALCLLNDSKRMPEGDELAIRDLCFEAGITLIICATKCDRLKRKELNQQITSISSAYGLQASDILPTGLKQSTDPLWERITGLL